MTEAIPELNGSVGRDESDDFPSPENPVDGPTDTPEGGDTGEAGDVREGSSSGNREARYRVERNEARAERDALSERVEHLLTREVERIAAKHLSHGADVFTLSGKSVQDFTDPTTGEVDAARVIQAANEILGTRPGLRPPIPAVDRSQGYAGPVGPAVPSWSSLLE